MVLVMEEQFTKPHKGMLRKQKLQHAWRRFRRNRDSVETDIEVAT